MDIANAFIGKAAKPSEGEVAAALGSSVAAWNDLLAWMAEEQGVAELEWKSVTRKYGWSLQVKLKKRTIVHLSPCRDCFRAGFVLGDKAVKAARAGKLSKAVLRAIDEAPRYAEGTGVRLMVKEAADLVALRKLVLLKLAN